MSGIQELSSLLANLAPVLDVAEYVFVCQPKDISDVAKWKPVACVVESEGLTLVVEKSVAEQADFEYEGRFRKITLEVHSDLNAIGLTAAVSGALAKAGISANMLAGYYHDHIFVPFDRAEVALQVLRELANAHAGA